MLLNVKLIELTVAESGRLSRRKVVAESDRIKKERMVRCPPAPVYAPGALKEGLLG